MPCQTLSSNVYQQLSLEDRQMVDSYSQEFLVKHNTQDDETISEEDHQGSSSNSSHKLIVLNNAVIEYYRRRLANLNPYLLDYLTQAEQDEWFEDLKFTYYLLSQLGNKEQNQGRYYKLGEYQEDLEKCKQALLRLKGEALKAHTVTPKKNFIANYFEESAENISVHKTGFIRRIIGMINERRLYWVWAQGSLADCLTLFSTDFFNIHQTNAAINTPSPITGSLSFGLYYFRFIMDLALLLKNALQHDELAEQSGLSQQRLQRLLDQWNLRKFSMLNDLIWATSNLLGFVYLKGNGVLGLVGNILTTALLLMDFGLNCYRAWEDWTNHQQQMAELQRNIASATDNAAIQKLEAIKQQKLFEWKYQSLNLLNDMGYSFALFMAYFLYFMAPIIFPLAVAPFVVVACSVLCFFFTTLTTGYSASLEVTKARESYFIVLQQSQHLYQIFTKTEEGDEKIKLYLEMQGLLATARYQKQQSQRMSIKVAHAVLIDALIPIIIFALFTFLPMANAILAIALIVTLAFCIDYALKKIEPKAPESDFIFDSNAYESFKQNVPQELLHALDNKISSLLPVDNNPLESVSAISFADSYGFQPIPGERVIGK